MSKPKLAQAAVWQNSVSTKAIQKDYSTFKSHPRTGGKAVMRNGVWIDIEEHNKKRGK